MNSAEFLRWERDSRDTLDFKKVYVDMTGDLAAGLLLSQIVYWHLPNREGNVKLRVQKDGHLWIAKQWTQWWAEVRLTEKQAIRAGEILASKGIVIKQVYKFAGDRTTHLRLDWDVFLTLWNETSKKSEEERNAEPGTRTKRPDLTRRPKAKDGEAKPRSKAKAEAGEGDLQNAEREFSKTPNGSFAKHPKGATENAETGLPITENTTKTFPETLQRGGEYNVTGNAPAPEGPEAQVSQINNAPITTTIASRPEDEGEADSPSASVAVLPPDGGDADASITDDELSFLFGDQGQANEKSATMTAPENVPPAAPPVVVAPVPASDEPHDPEETRALLVPALGGQKKLNDLMDETPPGLRYGQRRGWITQINPERAVEVIAEARKTAGSDNPWTYIIRALDKEVGGQIKGGKGGTMTAVTPMPGAYLTPEEQATREAALPPVAEGETWYGRRSGKAYQIAEVSSRSAFVEGLGEYQFQKFHSEFTNEKRG
ncbi:hypothetical protein [Deinococcus marmoris]|uniref:Uncharacterized protein n=1 Tax=Deinococcus marmoris TaxID=249408 RepID=A0A1U7P4U3_9DEIO|nr:hypothetical protein [Deinococcus marmoris]OLV20191.1 hypothetical protein BOO71_0000601 [Deinococcus marmoris]